MIGRTIPEMDGSLVPRGVLPGTGTQAMSPCV